MAKNIPTAERRVVGTGGATTKLSGSDPVASALQGIGSQLQRTAGTIKQLQDKSQAVKEQGRIDQLEIDRQFMLNKANSDFSEAQSGVGPQMTIEQKPEFMRARSEDWESQVKQDWDGEQATLDSFLLNTGLRTEKEQASYQAEVNGFQLERAVVSKEMIYNQSVQNQDFDGMKFHFDALEGMVGPAKATAVATQAQEAFFTESFVNIADIEGLDNALSSLNDPATREGFDFIDDGFISKTKKKNRQQKSLVQQAIKDTQRDNLYKAQEDIANGTLSPLQLEISKEAGKNPTTPLEDVGLDPRSARIVENKLLEDLIEQIPQEAWDIREEAAERVAEDNLSFRTRTKRFEAMIETEERFFDEIKELDSLSDNDLYALTMDWKNKFKASANPALDATLTDALVKSWTLEARLVGSGHRGVIIGGGLSKVMADITGKESPEEVIPKIEAVTKGYEGMLNELILNETSFRDTTQQSREFNTTQDADSSGLPAGTIVIVGGRRYEI